MNTICPDGYRILENGEFVFTGDLYISPCYSESMLRNIDCYSTTCRRTAQNSSAINDEGMFYIRRNPNTKLGNLFN